MQYEVLARDLQFPEGPVDLGRGRIAFTEIRGQRLSLYEKGAVRPIAETGGGPNGATLGPDGALYVTNNGGVALGHDGGWLAKPQIAGRLQRVTLDGGVEDFAAALPGKPPIRPNDLCFGPDGKLYYTDPHNWDVLVGGIERITELGIGRVGRASADGPVELLIECPFFPNGIAFGPDDRLYVAQSMMQQILVLHPEPGVEPETFATLPVGYPDGFCFDAEGRLYVAGSMGDVLEIFAPDGRHERTLDTGVGSEPTNCCFDASGRLYVTLAGRSELVAYDLGVKPLLLYPYR